eukprot:294007-Pelagomonas_calceolata.AAC.1
MGEWHLLPLPQHLSAFRTQCFAYVGRDVLSCVTCLMYFYTDCMCSVHEDGYSGRCECIWPREPAFDHTPLAKIDKEERIARIAVISIDVKKQGSNPKRGRIKLTVYSGKKGLCMPSPAACIKEKKESLHKPGPAACIKERSTVELSFMQPGSLAASSLLAGLAVKR